MKINELKQHLESRFSAHRYLHTIGVANEARRLARIYGIDEREAEIAGLLHDYAKNFSDDELLTYALQAGLPISEAERCAPHLLHGPVGALLAKSDYPNISEAIVQAIRCHTTGERQMGDLAKIIYISDIIEPNRHYPGVAELRASVGQPLNELTVKVIDSVILFLIANQVIIDPQTIVVRNEMVAQIKKSCQRS